MKKPKEKKQRDWTNTHVYKKTLPLLTQIGGTLLSRTGKYHNREMVLQYLADNFK